MELRPGYKQTEVGEIPIEWDVLSLGELFTFKNGLNKAKDFFGHGTPIVNYMDVYGHPGLFAHNLDGRVDVNKQELKAFEVRKGDVFFTRTSETVEEVGIASVMLDESINTVFSGFVLRARPKDDSLDNQFKKYCFSSSIVRKQITSKSTYTTRALTNGRALSTVAIACPPKPEQCAIAAALSDVDALINWLDQLIAKKRDIKLAAMQQLLTGKKRLPGFKQEWKVKRLGEVSAIKTGKKNNEDKITDGQYPFFVRSQTVERINTYSFDGEAILVPGEGGIGSIFHYVHGKFDYHQRVYKISDFNTDIYGKFIYYCMVQTFNKQAKRNSVKATVDSLRLPTFREFEFLSPSVEEQIAIATVLSDLDAELAALEQRREKTRALKQGIMQELLTGRIRLI